MKRIEDCVLAVCLSVVGLSLGGLWLLRRPTSWLSRQIDGATTDTSWVLS